MAIVLVMFFSLITALFTGGDACDKVPTMTGYEACIKACYKQPWFSLCLDTLRNAPAMAEVTIHALIATRLAKLKNDETVVTMDEMLADGSVPTGERAAVDYCKAKYGEVRGLMSSIEDHLFGCDFTQAKQEYLQRLFQASSKLFSMVSANLDATMVAYDVGALVVGRYVREGGLHASYG